MQRVIVSVKQQNEKKSCDLDLPADIPAGQLGEMIAGAMHWNAFSSGHQKKYEIEADPPGRLLLSEETLADAGVWDGAWLIIHSTIVSEDTVPISFLRALGDGKEITISKTEFIIGRNEDEVDLYLEGKKFSRLHAKITCQNGKYYVIDLGSKNGTYLNGRKLEAKQPYLLHAKDKIRLANVEYIYDEK